MAKILISGGSGLIGRAISELLQTKGHEVAWLSREAGNSRGTRKFRWDISQNYIDLAAFEGVDTLIHLAGSGIVDRSWTPAYKKQLIESRVKSSALLADTVIKNGFKIRTFIGASAIGYYGTSRDQAVHDEISPPGNDFLSEVCAAWEKSYQPFAEAGIRTAIIRTGIVLSRDGGAYAKIVPPFKFGLGAALGRGSQYFPWVHIKDIAGIYVLALQNPQLSGAYNAVAAQIITNKEFSSELAKSLHRPFFLPNIPAPLLKLALGERAVTLTEGLKISNHKIRAAGYEFKFEEIGKALKDLAA